MMSASPASRHPDQEQHVARRRRTPRRRGRGTRAACCAGGRATGRSTTAAGEPRDRHEDDRDPDVRGEPVQDADDPHHGEADDHPGALGQPRRCTSPSAGCRTTNPSDVRPSWRPYSNSVPPSVSMANGRRRTFQRPNANRTGAKTISVERRIGVPTRTPSPDLRFETTPGRSSPPRPPSARHERRRCTAPRSGTSPRRRRRRARCRRSRPGSPAAAKPIAVEPNELIDRNAFAADELLLGRDVRQDALLGRVEELLDRARQDDDRRTGRGCRSGSGTGC